MISTRTAVNPAKSECILVSRRNPVSSSASFMAFHSMIHWSFAATMPKRMVNSFSTMTVSSSKKVAFAIKTKLCCFICAVLFIHIRLYSQKIFAVKSIAFAHKYARIRMIRMCVNVVRVTNCKTIGLRVCKSATTPPSRPPRTMKCRQPALSTYLLLYIYTQSQPFSNINRFNSFI